MVAFAGVNLSTILSFLSVAVSITSIYLIYKYHNENIELSKIHRVIKYIDIAIDYLLEVENDISRAKANNNSVVVKEKLYHFERCIKKTYSIFDKRVEHNLVGDKKISKIVDDLNKDIIEWEKKNAAFLNGTVEKCCDFTTDEIIDSFLKARAKLTDLSK